MSNKGEQCLLTPPEVAEKLHVSLSHVYRMMVKGGLPYIKIGRSRRVHPMDLQKYILKNRETSNQEYKLPEQFV